eukprot:CAMPEP_0194158352 /NCGR_PEP_ID=MMETSP0152-20130528/75726_1 /TAXON_ID=1049557 /ORGANISM="Thalassiothrix antarctica, Strain L6-D1" /LENGTH=164 /DNA_ID=CAMNT_0038867529 /DNA_START=341 /DNA_END=835 /DNA_ORIENTATION=+
MGSCTVCEEEISPSFQASLLIREEMVQENMNYVDRVLDSDLPVVDDITNMLRTLEPPSLTHGLALQIYATKSELLEQLNELATAIDMQRRWIDCRSHLLGEDYFDEQTGFALERLGDMMGKAGDEKGALKAYQKAVVAFQTYRGSSSSYAKCAMNKVASVQNSS